MTAASARTQQPNPTTVEKAQFVAEYTAWNQAEANSQKNHLALLAAKQLYHTCDMSTKPRYHLRIQILELLQAHYAAQAEQHCNRAEQLALALAKKSYSEKIRKIAADVLAQS